MNKKISTFNWNQIQDLSEDEIEIKIHEILSQMTLSQKIDQLSGDIPFITGGIAMMIRYNGTPIPAGECKELGIPPFGFSDGPRGVVMNHSTCFPVSIARGAFWDPLLEERIGDAIGTEIRSLGGDYYAGICINLLRHPAWGRAQESYGEDSFVLGTMGAALVKGTQRHVMACIKHFAANSIERSRFKVNVKVDERTLREIYLPHFKRCMNAGCASVMSAYNKVNGEFCGHNHHLLTEILKEDWGFKGFVSSDFVYGVRDGMAAVKGGMDVEMPFALHMRPKLLSRYMKKGLINEQQINESVIRILRQKMRFNHHWDAELYSKTQVASKAHTQLALESARKSMVLLKNENHVLPLDRTQVHTIAIIGELAKIKNIGDHGSSRVFPPYVVTAFEGIKKVAGPTIKILYYSGKDAKKAALLAKQVDTVVLIVGYRHYDEGEFVYNKGGDRTSLRIYPREEKLIQAVAASNRNCVVVLETGSALIIEEWKDFVPVILLAWYPGMEGGTAIGEILFGDVNPSGKLPVTFPKSTDQLPFFDRNTTEITYEYYHGYHLFDKKGLEPAFPFGFGLSYTTFAYDNLQLDKTELQPEDTLQISVDVTNTGALGGEEIVQLYIGENNSEVDRPIKELKGFDKVALDSGETKHVTISVPTSELAYFNVEEKRWKIETISYTVYVGSSSRTNDLQMSSFQII